MKRIFFAFLILVAGCKESVETPMQIDQAQPAAQTGIVAEMLEVENYTYIRLESESNEVWIATLPVWVSPGDVIEFTGGAIMKDFYSETLGRKFDAILFVDDVQILDQASGQEIVAEAHSKYADPSSQSTASVTQMDAITPVGDGKTIAQIFESYADQEGQTVQLRARVVKVNSGILNKNWVTLEDGTGAAPNDQIVSTTLDTVSPGDLVDVIAIIKKDIDLGYGYKYNVLLEEASFSLVEKNQGH